MADSSVRIDGAGNYMPYDDDDAPGIAKVVALPGGGYVVMWLADTTGDDDADTLAIQRYDANGTKLGSVVLLHDLPDALTNQQDNGAEAAAVDLTPLANGGYALTYAMQLTETFHNFQATSQGTSIFIGIAGRPSELNFVSPFPAGAHVYLVGTVNGVQTAVELTVDGNEVEIPRALVDQFTVNGRYQIRIDGVPNGQAVNVNIGGLQTFLYDPDGPLNSEAATSGQAANGSAFLASPHGRVEAFDIESVTPSGASASYVLIINPARGTDTITTAGIPGASKLPSGLIVVTGLTPDANGVIAVPQAILDQLDGDDASIVLQVNGLVNGTTVSAHLAVRPEIVQAEGIFVQTFDADGDPTGPAPVRIDGAGNYMPYDDADNAASVVALSSGGFAVQWLADVTGDDDGDTLAIQRYDANGAKVGGVVLLNDLPQAIIHQEDNGAELQIADLTPLANGGYALTYAMQLAEASRVVATTGNGSVITIPVVGRPVEITVGTLPAGAKIYLTGDIEGTQGSVPLTVVDGEIEISRALLSQFTPNGRHSIQIQGVANGEQVIVTVHSQQMFIYDPDAPLATESTAATVANGVGVLALNHGRVESFHIDSVTPAGGSANYLLFISPATDPQAISLAGVPNASVQPNGILITGLTPDANGVIAVPQSILNQIDNKDATIYLVATGLVNGSTFSGTLSVREEIPQTEGIFVQTFDAAGNSIGGEPVRIDGIGHQMPYDDAESSTASVVALASGGFVVQWAADTTGDDDVDTLAIQRYNDSGAKVGSVMLLQGLPNALTNQQDNGAQEVVVDLTPLADGRYALTYAMQLTETSRNFQTTSQGTSIFIGIAGRPSELNFVSPFPAGAHVYLVGTVNGVQTAVELSVDGNEVEIPRALFDQFTVNGRYQIRIDGVPNGQAVNVNIGGLQTFLYDPDGPLNSEAATSGQAANGSAFLASPHGRVEAFDIESVTPSGASASYVLIINPARGANTISTAGIPGASKQPSGLIVVTGLTPDANGVIAVPQAILNQLDGDDASIILQVNGLTNGTTVSAHLMVRPEIPQAEGIFTQTFAVTDDANGRIDGPGNYMPYDDETSAVAQVVALSGGGYAVTWLADTNGDDDGDTLAIQRYGANGQKQGAVVLLHDLPPALTNDEDSGAEAAAIDLTPLANGGYALTYAMQLAEAGKSVHVTSNGNSIFIPVAGRPVEIGFPSGLPAGATVWVTGNINGSPAAFQLTLVDGDYEVPRSVIDQFTVAGRYNIRIDGVPNGQSIDVNIGSLQMFIYDKTAPLDSEAASVTVANGQGILSSPHGRVEAFDIENVTPVGANATYTLFINPAVGPQSINLSGIPNATVTPNGIRITGLTPDANGVIAVPQAIINQLDSEDAGIFLVVSGLVNGSTLAGHLAVREEIPQAEGVFVKTFDADGNPTGPDPVRIDGPGNYMPYDGDDAQGVARVVSLSGGGFAVQWLADVTGDGDGDTLAIQRYDSNGAKVGSVVLLQNLPQAIVNQQDNGAELTTVDLTPLANGGYALTYAMQLTEANHHVDANGNGQVMNIAVAGRPVEINIIDLPAGATIFLSGTVNGNQVLVPLEIGNGEIEISRELLSQFTVEGRYAIVVQGVPNGGHVDLWVNSQQMFLYDSDGPLDTEARSATAVNGVATLALPHGRVEAFDIDSVSPSGASATYLLFVAPALGPQTITGIPNSFVTPTGLMITGLQPDANGVIQVPQAVLDQLGDNDATIFLVATGLVDGSTFSGTLSVRDEIPQAEGIFVQTFNASGHTSNPEPVRIDGPGNYMPYDDDDSGVATVVALSNGGFAVQWRADTDGDDDGDTLAIQRYDANGAKVGAVVVLTNLPEALTNQQEDHGAEAQMIDLTPLDGGGYALTYAMQLHETSRLVQATGNGQTIFIAITGRPVEIEVGQLPAGATIYLSGNVNGSQVLIPLSAAGGEIEIPREMLAQFTAEGRYGIQIQNVPNGQQVSLTVTSQQMFLYDPEGPLAVESATATAVNGNATLASLHGRVEAFDVEHVAPAGANAGYLLFINPALGPQSITYPGAVTTPTGLMITGLTPDANGVIAVPQAILDQLGIDDATIFLVATGLVEGSTFSGTVSVREEIPQPEGIFVHNFTVADGVVADGYVAGATVFVDIDGDGVLDANEPFTVTDANGDYALDTGGAVGPIRAIGGTNIDTGLANLVTLSAPEGSTVINPLTSIVQALIETSPTPLTQQQAQDQVKSALGIAAGIDLTTVDILATANSDPDALQAQKAAASVVVILNQVLETAGGSQNAVGSALGVIVEAVANAGSGTVDLTDQSLLTEIVTTAVPTADPTAVTNFVDNTGTFNTSIQNATDTSQVAAVQQQAAPSVAIAVDDAVSTLENAIVSGSLFANNGSGVDVDPDGPALQIEKVNGSAVNVGTQITLASGAKLTVNADGSYSYNPNGKFNSLTTAASGATNTSATDSFTYSLLDGGTATVTVTINGVVSVGDTLGGNSGANDITGTTGGDLFNLSQGGDDKAHGLGGNDGFYFGAAMTGADEVDGGAGTLDQIGLQGNYTGGNALTLGANGAVGVEMLILLPGSNTAFGDTSGALYSYDVTTVDANVGAGQTFVVNANTLRAGENLTFNGAAELDGTFLTYGGLGNDHLTGGQKVDGFFFGDGGRFGSGDTVDGQGQGVGQLDQLGLQGNYSGVNAVTFGASQITNIEMIVLLSGTDTRFGGTGANYNFDITMNDGNVASGQKMIINANTLVAAESVTFNGGAESNGYFQIFGGNGNDSYIGSQGNDDIWGGGGADTITGGLGADTLHGGAGDDIFRYTSTAHSTAVSMDSILDFATGDKVDVSAIDAIAGGADDAFSFVGAAAFTGTGTAELQAVNTGGNNWTVSADVDGNGSADLVIAMTVTDAHSLTGADFVL